MASKFDEILAQGVRAGQIPARTQSARDWFRNKARGTSATPESVVRQEKARYKNRVSMGKMYLFNYDPKTKDTIGNFVLLPKGLNSALQDRPWEVKQLFLKVLLSDDMSGRISLVSKAKANGIELPPSIEKNVLDSSAVSLTKSHMLSGLENVTTWDGDYIRKRSERLCELVWDKMKEWLD